MFTVSGTRVDKVRIQIKHLLIINHREFNGQPGTGAYSEDFCFVLLEPGSLCVVLTVLNLPTKVKLTLNSLRSAGLGHLVRYLQPSSSSGAHKTEGEN